MSIAMVLSFLVIALYISTQIDAYNFRVPVFKSLPTFKIKSRTSPRFSKLQSKQAEMEKDIKYIQTSLSALHKNVSYLTSEDSHNSSDVSTSVKQEAFDSMNLTVTALETAFKGKTEKDINDINTSLSELRHNVSDLASEDSQNTRVKNEKDIKDIKTSLSELQRNVTDFTSEYSKKNSRDFSGFIKQEAFDSMQMTVAALEKSLKDVSGFVKQEAFDTMNIKLSALENTFKDMKKEKTDSTGVSNSDSANNNPGSCSSIPGFRSVSATLCLKVSDKSDKRIWSDSRTVCRAFGGDLATFKDKTENKQALDYVRSVGTWEGPSRVRVWVGFRRVDKTTYNWISNSTYAGLWGLYQPKDMSSMKCVGLVRDGLSNSMCMLSERYLCQIDN